MPDPGPRSASGRGAPDPHPPGGPGRGAASSSRCAAESFEERPLPPAPRARGLETRRRVYRMHVIGRSISVHDGALLPSTTRPSGLSGDRTWSLLTPGSRAAGAATRRGWVRRGSSLIAWPFLPGRWYRRSAWRRTGVGPCRRWGYRRRGSRRRSRRVRRAVWVGARGPG